MFKRIAVALVLVLGVAGAAEAQDATAEVSVTVYQALSLTAADNTVDFGITNPSVAPAAIDPNTGGAASAMFVAAGQSGVPILVTYPASLTLDNGFGATADFTPDLVGADASADRATAPAVADNTTVTLNASTGSYFFWLGGSLTAPTTTGSYTGDFTLSIAY